MLQRLFPLFCVLWFQDCVWTTLLSALLSSCLYNPVDGWTNSLVLFPHLQVSTILSPHWILVLFPHLQSPWCSVTQGPFQTCFWHLDHCFGVSIIFLPQFTHCGLGFLFLLILGCRLVFFINLSVLTISHNAPTCGWHTWTPNPSLQCLTWVRAPAGGPHTWVLNLSPSLVCLMPVHCWCCCSPPTFVHLKWWHFLLLLPQPLQFTGPFLLCVWCNQTLGGNLSFHGPLGAFYVASMSS